MTPLQEMKLMAEAGERARLSLTAERDALAAQHDEGLAREAELRAQIAELQQTGAPHFCSLPMSKNPHPEAGIPGRYLEVGAVAECIPCLVASRHSWAKTAASLQQRLAEAEKLIAKAPEHPAGAIHNGRVAIDRLESTYEFQEQMGHRLALCSDWQEVVRCFEYLASHAEQVAFLASPGCADGEKAE